MQVEALPIEQKNEIFLLIKKRWSPKEFDPAKRISQNDLTLLFEAARWTPSSRNEQPWNFIVVTKDEPEQFNKMIDLLTDGNKSWASTASALILTVASLQLSHNNSGNSYAYYDLGASVANLTIQAIALNIYIHQMGGFYRDKAKEVFHLNENYAPVSVLAAGYLPGNENFETRKNEVLAKRKRKPLNEFVFKNNWGKSFFNINDFQKN